MPEGDTVYVHARQLVPLLVGQPVVDARSRWPRVVQGLVGTSVKDIRSIGKHLLVHISDGTTLRIHLGMNGGWRRVGPGEDARISMGQVSLRLDTLEHGVICSTAPTVERFRTRQLAVHPVLSCPGPDLLAEDFDADAVVDRAMALGNDLSTVSEVLLDQRIACGIGNVYKSEVLFLQGLDPFVAPSTVLRSTWIEMYTRVRRLMQSNLQGAPRDTTGRGFRGPRLWVYGRKGRSCLRCGGAVQSRIHGGKLPRVTYWCLRCQNDS